MNKKVTLLLVGIGGFGATYVEEILNLNEESNVYISGIVEVAPESCPYLPKLKEMRIPMYASIEEFYKHGSADLAIISTPIHFHCYQTCYALSHGSNVLCEKPVSATIQEAIEMKELRNKVNKFVAIGYQWSYTDAILKLKEDINSGLFGKPRRLKTIVLWPRDQKYYHRSAWAGKRKNEDGRWILDSVANNATAHYLHNMFFLTGSNINSSGIPKSVTAELYRANNIENFDTSIIRTVLEDDTEVMFYASHALKEHNGLRFYYEFEKAVITYDNNNTGYNEITAVFTDGRKKLYGNPDNEKPKKLLTCMEAIRNGIDIPCGLEAAMSHTICINGAQESMATIKNFPENIVKYDKEAELVWVDGLKETLLMCYDNWEMPAEAGISWAASGKEIDVRGYKFFKE